MSRSAVSTPGVGVSAMSPAIALRALRGVLAGVQHEALPALDRPAVVRAHAAGDAAIVEAELAEQGRQRHVAHGPVDDQAHRPARVVADHVDDGAREGGRAQRLGGDEELPREARAAALREPRAAPDSRPGSTAPRPPTRARPRGRARCRARRGRPSADEREAWHSIANGPSRRAARPRPPRFPPVLVRAARLPHRHVDAERGAIVARARADELPVPARPDRRAPVRPHPPLLVPVRGDQRSGAQAAAAPRHADRAHAAGLHAGRPGLERPRAVLARGGAGRPLRPRHHARHAVAPGLRRPPGAPRRSHERDRAELGGVQRRPRGRPRGVGPAGGALRHRGRLRDERPQLHRGDRRPRGHPHRGRAEPAARHRPPGRDRGRACATRRARPASRS